MAGSSDELEFVQNCLRLHFGSDSAAVALENAIQHSPHWHGILTTAGRQGVVPLLRQSIRKLDRTRIPNSVESRIRTDFQGCAANSLLYARELTRIESAFQRSGVRCLALKGPALAVRLYGKLSLRQCRDLDLLVARSDVTGAIDILSSLGFRLEQPGPSLRTALRIDKHLVLVHQELATRVEVHWAVALPSLNVSMPFDSLWEDRDSVSVLGTRINVPGAEQMLAMLCVHWASHCWASLKWACDIAAFLQVYSDLDWTRVCERARRRGCLRMLLVAMELARNVTGVSLPDPVRRKLQGDAVIPRLCREVQRRSFTTDDLVYEQRLMSYFSTRDGILDKIRFGIRHFRSLVALRTRLRRIASRYRCRAPDLKPFA